MKLRKATKQDIPLLAAAEAIGFPPAEAASPERLAERVRLFGEHFLLLFDGDLLVGFIDGMVSVDPILRDSMFADASLHRPEGDWQMIFGLTVIPSYRKQGCAARMLRAFIDMAKAEGRKGVVLTCKEPLVSYYASFGFVNEGASESVHGGAAWFLMRLTFS